jgi:polyisoprenoid-binding protein YceI
MVKDVVMILLLSLNLGAAISGTAEFIARANPGFLEIEGKGGIINSPDFEHKDGKISGTFTVKSTDFDTGMDTRNEHMQGYLNSKKYPDIIFKLDPVLFAAGTRKAFTGKLTLNGKTKKVAGTVAFNDKNAIASFTVNVTDFGIEVPTYKLLTVGKDVDIKATIPL